MTDDGAAPRRLFLVGCPRSGTTLLQSLVAAHPDVVTFPETHFFYRMSVERGEGDLVAGPQAGQALAHLADLVGPVPVGAATTPSTVGELAAAFTATLDAATAQRGARAWLEKTPIHLWYVDDIEAHVPGARFVHLVRDGAAVVASLVEVTRRYPDQWGGRRSAQQCLERWVGDVRRSQACVGRPGHVFVSYERLVEDVHGVLGRLVEQLGLSGGEAAVERMVTHYRDEVDHVVRQEPWKAGVRGGIVDAGRAKVDSVLAEPARERVRVGVERARPVVDALPFL